MRALSRWRARWAFRIRTARIVRKVNRLDIAASGIDSDGHAWLRMVNGKVFYGFRTKRAFRKYFLLVRPARKVVLSVEALQLAVDIVVRYDGGALVAEGPLKQRNYRVRKGDVVVEMGAYLGHYVMRLAEQVGESGRVVAIEANPNNYSILEKNIHANDLKQVIIVKTGVWNRRDSLPFSIRDEDNQSSSVVIERETGSQVSVPVSTLDEILGDCDIGEIQFMIIQLNGAEPEALEGLTRQRPVHLAITSRYSANGVSTTGRIVELLQRRGYSTCILNGDFVYAGIAGSGAE